MSLAVAINRAGRTRMLSQRIAKLSLQIAMDVIADRARPLFANSARELNTAIEDLRRMSNSPSIAPTFAAWETQAKGLIAAAATPQDIKFAQALAERSDETLKSANAMTAAFESVSRANGAKVVNTAGRQRMLSQRMARFYFQRESGQRTPAVTGELERSRVEFAAALKTLGSAPISTPQIKANLDLAEQQWLFFDTAIRNEAGGRQGLTTVATTSERLLEVLDSLTAQYEAALKDVLGSVAEERSTMIALLG
jgi:hypothetical protein